MTRLVMAGIKRPWQIMIFDYGWCCMVEVWQKISRVELTKPFYTRAAAENWAREKARELRIVRNGEAR